MPKELHVCNLSRRKGVPWGIRIGGGQDRGRVLVLEKVTYHSVAYEAGLRTRDYIVEVNGQSVFGLNHDQCKELIQKAGDHMVMRIERGDHIVPNMEEAFPKKGQEQQQQNADELDEVLAPRDKPYWIKSIEEGKGVSNSTGFTTVGKPKMGTKQYNSPLEMYSEEALEEIMKEGTLHGKPFDITNLMNPTGKDFDSNTSAVLAYIQANQQNANRRT